MSMSTCKCGKVFDSDFEMGMDEKGNCCCDDCDSEMYEEMSSDIGKLFDRLDALEKADSNIDPVGTAVDVLMNLGYRKIK